MKLLRLLTVLLILALAGQPLAFATATGTPSPYVALQFFTNNGVPAAGYQLFTYTAGTSTKVTTYTDVGLSSANLNPIILDSAGRCTIFLSPGISYKYVLANTTDTDPPVSPIWTRDNVSSVPPSSTASDNDVTGTAGEALSAGDAVYLSDGSGGATAGRWYKADADNTYSSSTAQVVGFATAAISSASSGTIRRSGRVTGLSALVAGTLYYVSTTNGALTAASPTNQRAILQADSTTTGIVIPGAPIGSSTIQGFISLGTQTLGSGTKTVDAIVVTGAITAGGTINYKPGGASSLSATGSGVLNVDTTQHANSGTGETDLSSYTVPANTLNANGKALRITAWGSFAANGNTKTLKFYFGGTSVTISAGGAAPNGVVWMIDAIVVRTGASAEKMFARHTDRSGGTSEVFAAAGTPAGDTTTGLIVKTTGTSGTASSDILQEGFIVEVVG